MIIATNGISSLMFISTNGGRSKKHGTRHYFQNAVTPEIMGGTAPYLGHRGILGAPSILPTLILV